MEKVGHQEQAIGRGQQLGIGPLKGEQLKERVELHELQAGLGEDFSLGHSAEGVRKAPSVRESR